MHQPTVCVDIDGTLILQESWKGEDYFAPLQPGAKAAMDTLRRRGWFIILYTSRGKVETIKKWAEENKIPFDAINENPNFDEEYKSPKPISDCYIDDRAISFTNWETALLQTEFWDPRRWDEDDCRKLVYEDEK
jgi:hydroxymethylpyrimidine pyrophosphatase-like HAD family hydrolase